MSCKTGGFFTFCKLRPTCDFRDQFPKSTLPLPPSNVFLDRQYMNREWCELKFNAFVFPQRSLWSFCERRVVRHVTNVDSSTADWESRIQTTDYPTCRWQCSVWYIWKIRTSCCRFGNQLIQVMGLIDLFKPVPYKFCFCILHCWARR